MDAQTILSLLDATIRLSTPLLLACLAGLFSERAGMFDIGLEGKMLTAAFAAGAIAALTGSAWLGLLAGMIVSLFVALLQGFAAITMRGNQLIAGLAINMLAAGLTTFLGQTWYSRGGATPSLEATSRFMPINLPFAESLSGVPLLGPIYSDLLSGHSLPVYAAFAAVAVTAFVLYRTRYGLRLRAVGENPKAVDTAGVSVAWMRYQAVIVTGILCGLAGTYFAIAQGSAFANQMTAGKGYIALAALIFAKWRPFQAMLACLFFGFLDALQIRLQGSAMFGFEIPVQAIQALPYVLTVVLLAGFIGNSVGPRAAGVPYTKER